MQILCEPGQLNSAQIKMLYDHFNYSMKDIDSYDELTDKEKNIISKEDFTNLMAP